MLSLNPQIIILQAVAFVAMILLFQKYLFGPINAILDGRREEVQKTLDQVAQDRQAMEATRADYEARLANIEAEGRERIAAAVKEAQAEAAAILQKARADADAARERASADIDQQGRIALANIRAEAADLIVTATSRVLRETVDDATQKRLISQFVADVGSTPTDAGHA